MSFTTPQFGSWATEATYASGYSVGLPTKVAPAGDVWIPNTKPGAPQLNYILSEIGADHAALFARALDKTGDTLVGTVHVTGVAKISADVATAVVATIAEGIVSSAIGGIQSTVAFGITAGVAEGIAANTAGGIVGNVANGIAPTVAGGIGDGGVTGGIAPTVAGGILSSVFRGIESALQNGLVSTTYGGIAPTVLGGISDGGVAGGIAATTPGGIQSLYTTRKLTSAGTYLVDSSTPFWDDVVFFATTGIAITANLPASPDDGRRITFTDALGFAVSAGSSYVVGGNGHLIAPGLGTAASVTFTSAGQILRLQYSVSVGYWIQV
jgi:hypothetical protein